VLAPDLRGFGRSDAPPGDYAKHVFVADLIALLDAEGIDRATIIGHDWGAWTAWLAALEHPDRVERFVSIDVPPPWRTNLSIDRVLKQLVFGTYQYAISSPLLGQRLVANPAVVRKFISAGSAREFEWDEGDLDAYAQPLSEPARARASVHLYRTFLMRELPAMLRGRYTRQDLRVPGLAIFGARSAIRKITELPDHLPQLQTEVIDGAGHYVPEEKPAEVAALVRAFLAA
jgi:pimeloyl-ACP methyl ester carboxylesterase